MHGAGGPYTEPGDAARADGPAAAGEGGAAPAAPGSLPVRVLRVVVSPGRLFEALRTEPRWLGAALLGALVVALSTLLIPGEIWDEMFRRQMLQSGQELPEGMDLGTVQRVAAVVGGSLFWFIWIFVVAGGLTVVFGFLLGDDGRYRQYLSVTAHALIIPALGGLATVPLRIARRDPQLTLNLGLFVPIESGYFASLLMLTDLFLVWAWVVIGLGVHVIDPRRSWSSATAIVMALSFLLLAALAFVVPT